MNVSSFRLATHANAALGGRSIDWGALPDLSDGTEWVFLVPGPNGHKLRQEPRAWVSTMRALGVRRAWYGFGPSAELSGDGVWTEGAGGACFYLASGRRIEEDAHLRITLKGHPAPALRPPENLDVARSRFLAALPPILEYAREYRHDEFVSWLEEALDLLEGRQNPPAEAFAQFPPGIYSPEHATLFAAARRGDVVGHGGMGSWYDFTPPARDELFRVALTYTAALYPAFTAASALDLSLIDPGPA